MINMKYCVGPSEGGFRGGEGPWPQTPHLWLKRNLRHFQTRAPGPAIPKTANDHCSITRSQIFVLRKSQESFSIQIMKKL